MPGVTVPTRTAVLNAIVQASKVVFQLAHCLIWSLAEVLSRSSRFMYVNSHRQNPDKRYFLSGAAEPCKGRLISYRWWWWWWWRWCHEMSSRYEQRNKLLATASQRVESTYWQ